MIMEERAGERRFTGGRSAPLPNPLPARASRGEGEAESQADAYFNASGASPWAEEFRAVGAERWMVGVGMALAGSPRGHSMEMIPSSGGMIPSSGGMNPSSGGMNPSSVETTPSSVETTPSSVETDPSSVEMVPSSGLGAAFPRFRSG